VNPAIKRTIFFGPSPNSRFAPARVDTFQATNHLLTSLPTNGPSDVRCFRKQRDGIDELRRLAVCRPVSA
jgi:hypothetical protein